jgi:hypothetical protein
MQPSGGLETLLSHFPDDLSVIEDGTARRFFDGLSQSICPGL